MERLCKDFSIARSSACTKITETAQGDAHSVGVSSESEGRAKSPQRGLLKFQVPAFLAARSVRWPCTRTSRTCLLECKLDGPELSEVVTK